LHIIFAKINKYNLQNLVLQKEEKGLIYEQQLLLKILQMPWCDLHKYNAIFDDSLLKNIFNNSLMHQRNVGWFWMM